MCGELEQYAKMVKFLADTLGNTFEAGLFDLTDPALPIVAESKRFSDVQEKIRELVVSSLDHQPVQAGQTLTNCPVQLDFDKLLKVSVFFIRNAEGTVIGALWLSMRCDLFLKMESFAANMLQFCSEDIEEAPEAAYRAAARELSLDTVTEVIRSFGDAPARMTLAERQEVICDLYDMGAYNLRGAVAKTAELMQISEQSVYRYIAKIKKARDW